MLLLAVVVDVVVVVHGVSQQQLEVRFTAIICGLCGLFQLSLQVVFGHKLFNQARERREVSESPAARVQGKIAESPGRGVGTHHEAG